MSRETTDGRPGWFWPLIAFVIGLLVGWLAIGWAAWPVTWKNALPPDLRPAERDEYLIMAAESYQSTRDAELARFRVATWPDDQLAQDLNRLQERLASENTVQADQVKALATVLSAEGGAGPVTTAPPPAPTSGLGAALKSICPGALYVLLIVLGLVLILWLWRRWRTSQESQPSPASTRNSASSAKPGRAPATAGTWPESEEQVFDRTGQFAEPETMSSQPPEPAPLTSKPVEQVAVAGAMAGTAAKRPIAAGPAGQPGSGSERAATELISVGTFQAVYQLGEPDYDEAFDVTDPKSGHVGQCGLALTDPIGRGHDQAAALQVWLWDTNDPNTKVKVLMSEGAYRDTALRDQLAGEQQAIPVRLGTEFDLESYNLLLRGKVDRLEYAQQEPAYGIFAELLVRLEVYRKV